MNTETSDGCFLNIRMKDTFANQHHENYLLVKESEEQKKIKYRKAMNFALDKWLAESVLSLDHMFNVSKCAVIVVVVVIFLVFLCVPCEKHVVHLIEFNHRNGVYQIKFRWNRWFTFKRFQFWKQKVQIPILYSYIELMIIRLVEKYFSIILLM